MKNKESSGPLDGYREQLKALRRANEVMAGLRERAAGLEARAKELSLEAAGLLDSDEVERESALSVTRNVIEGKLSRARAKLEAAEKGLSAQISGMRGEFGRLHLIFKLHRIEIEKARLQEQMISGCRNLSLEQVCLHLKAIANLQQLEITAADVVGLLGQAQKLLETLAAESGFEVPPVSTPSSDRSAQNADARAETEWSGPWDPLDGSIEIRQLMALDPNLNLATLHLRLRAKFPHLYKKREEVLAMNAPLPALATGVYQEAEERWVKTVCGANRINN